MLALAGDPEPTWVSGEAVDVSGEPADSRASMDPTGNGRVGLSNGVHGYVSEHGATGGLSFEVLGENGRLLILDDARTVHLLNVETGAQLGAMPKHQPQPLDLPAPPGRLDDGAGSRARPRASGEYGRQYRLRYRRGAAGHGDRVCAARLVGSGRGAGGGAGRGSLDAC